MCTSIRLVGEGYATRSPKVGTSIYFRFPYAILFRLRRVEPTLREESIFAVPSTFLCCSEFRYVT